MTVQVIAIRMAPSGTHPQHITQLKYFDRTDATVGVITVAQLIAFIGTPGKVDCLSNSGIRTEVEVVQANPQYVRSKADGSAADNLLSLPRF